MAPFKKAGQRIEPAKVPQRPRKEQGAADETMKKVTRLQVSTAVLAAVAAAAVGAGAWAQADAGARVGAAYADTQEIVVLANTVAAGQVIQEADLASVSVPGALIVDGALSADDVKDPDKSPVGRAAASYLPKGSQVTASSTSGAGNPASLADSIAAGYEAVTVPVDSASGMAGLLHAGDEVRVLIPASDEVGGTGVKVVSDGCRVAAVGNIYSDGGTGDYSTVTLEVTPEQAEVIRGAGAVTLTLPSAAGKSGSASAASTASASTAGANAIVQGDKR